MNSPQTPPEPTPPEAPPHNPYTPPASSPSAPPAHVDNHLIWAILSTLFCCLPAGIVSIVYSSKVNSLLLAGDIEGARRASKNAATWAIVSAGGVVVLLGIYFVVVLIGVGVGILDSL